MHRRIKGLLSLMMVFVMAAGAANPVWADELLQESPAAEEMHTEPEPEQPQTMTEAEPETTGEQPVTEETTTQPESAVQAVTEAHTAEEQPTEEGLVMKAAELEVTEYSGAEEVQVASTGDAVSDPYDSLTSEQKQFHVYAGTQPIKPLSEVLGEDPNDVLARLKFLDGGVIPDSGNMPAQSGAIVKEILNGREGDARFYRLSGWNLWSVRYDGIPIAVYANAGSTGLEKLAIMENFRQCAYLDVEGTSTEPNITFYKPILEPVWGCIDYPIPVYDAQGQNTGLTVTINAENYNDPSKVAFPDVEADGWKLVYEDSECQLNSASEIWTNTTNGIATIGRDFDEKNAKLQACVLSATEESKYEILGPQGNEGWYTGAVTIRAKDGYQLRLSVTDAWTDAVTVTQSGDVTLYVKKTDGTEYPTETLQFLIDETDPVINGIQNGMTYYGDTAVTVTDAFLLKVTVNDALQTIADNQASFVLNPSGQPFIIKADDMAGNWTECIVWVKDAETPPVLQEGTAEFIQPGWYEGEEMPAPLVSSETNGIDHITYFYKKAGADDSTYTTTVPDKVGKYTAKAVFAATQFYQEVIKTSDFEILVCVKPDETAPVISGVSDGQSYYGDQTVIITDESLRLVTVNGEAVTISDNRAEFTLKPSDNAYKIIAEDMAGNRTEYTVEVWETWVRDGITTNGKKNLRRARIYRLGGGKWSVAGDNTVYQGGRTFYVKNSGTYDFKKK